MTRRSQPQTLTWNTVVHSKATNMKPVNKLNLQYSSKHHNATQNN